MGNGKNIWENVIIFILIGVIICFVTPIIQGIFFSTQLSNAKSNATELVKMSRILYGELSLRREVVLPFSIEFNEDGTYNLYENTTKIADKQILTNGKGPKSGTIILDENSYVTAKNIRYGDIVCQKETTKTVNCFRQKETGK